MSRSPSFFFFLFLVSSGSVWLTGCRSTPSGVSSYFNEAERDTLLVNIITYMDRLPAGADRLTRFNSRYRSHYVAQLPKYRFEQYTVTPDSTHYYFIIRPVGEGKRFRRGVGGRFKLGTDLSPVDFEEMWCTPHFKDDSTISQRGRFLFAQMVKTGNVNDYLNMKHYVEWPDSTLVYDKRLHEWVTPDKSQ